MTFSPPPRTGGSSPLARGLPGLAGGDGPAVGIIPARAGFTNRNDGALPPIWDHPRSRGVYSDNGETAWLPLGSSPLARGLLRLDFNVGDTVRIIPARAGFTGTPMSPSLGPTDHPRSRGVYAGHVVLRSGKIGSSPLARGLLFDAPSGGFPGRIIPARAGFTPPPTASAAARVDHPRSRGVYWNRVEKKIEYQGSSPLARGLPLGRAAGESHKRIIPARAGFTPGAARSDADHPDHPRSRGVYLARHAAERPGAGSSPLARGLRVMGGERSYARRIIPARAGFTRT